MKEKIDWVFWVQIERREWFKNFWKSRGGNSLTVHILGFHISIGMPWLQTVIDMADKNYPLEGINHFHKINEANRKGRKFRYITENK